MDSSTVTSDSAAGFRFTETQDWFSHNIAHWTPLIALVQSHTNTPRALEIGSWEGRSAVFLLNNLCSTGGEVVCIDHFDLFHTDAGRARFSALNHNLSLTGKSFRVLSEFSIPALIKLLGEESISGSVDPGFDWVYVDGSHEADDTFLDGELAWRLAKEGAVFIFDDYHWDKEPEESSHHPQRGIDAFLTLHRGEYEMLSVEEHYQVVLRKLTPMRIGFLLASQGKIGQLEIQSALEYGINVAFAVDAAYIVPATVAIRSLIDHTPGRISIYVVDYGLAVADKERLQTSVPTRGDVTLIFLAPKEGNLAMKMGIVWAKLDLHRVLPVERVLYLDADVLVRGSLKELWDTDLGGKAVAAAQDIGHPMGHGDVKAPYFNAGVLLMNLTKVRGRSGELDQVAESMENSLFKDQDALNRHFADDWAPLHLRWNAQGLGTYARYPSAERDQLDLTEMEDPAIVHFTGPVHPRMAEVLNPHIQPATSKPWGYAGAPGHPFQNEWWSVLERTSWSTKSFRESWALECKAAREKAVVEGVREFQARAGVNI